MRICAAHRVAFFALTVGKGLYRGGLPPKLVVLLLYTITLLV